MKQIPANYREAVDYIEELPKFTEKHPLKHTKKYCKGTNADNLQKNPEKSRIIGRNHYIIHTNDVLYANLSKNPIFYKSISKTTGQ